MADSRRYEKEIGLERFTGEAFTPSRREIFAPGGFREDDDSAPMRRELFAPEGFSDDEAAAPPRRKRSFIRENWLMMVVILNLVSVSTLFFIASGGHPLDHARQIVRGVSQMVTETPAEETRAIAAPRRAAQAPIDPREEFRQDPDGVWRNQAIAGRVSGE